MIMKLNENFTLKNVAGSWVVLPVNQATLDFNGMLALNESGVLLWRALEQGADKEELVNVLTREYSISEEIARTDT